MKKFNLNELRAAQQKLEEEKKDQERKARIAGLPALVQLAVAAMKACGALTWHNKHSPADAEKKSELAQKVKESAETFKKAYRKIVGNGPDNIKNWWGAELQKEYVKGASKALLEYYLSDEPDKTKPLAYKLEEAADQYVRGWGMLGKKDRKALHGPLERIGNGKLAVEMLIEQLREGDEIQKIQVQILEGLFEGPISALGTPAQDPEAENFKLGQNLSPKNEDSAE